MIDWDRIKELHEEVGAEDFDEILELFLEEVEGALAKLETIADRNFLGEDLHFLKGSALNLGFSKLADLCKAGEAAAAVGQQDTVDLDNILSTYAQSKEVFLAEISGKLAA